MKIALITSLILNVLLVGKLVFFQEEKPPLERIIIKDFPEATEERSVVPVIEKEKKPVKPKSKKPEYGDILSDAPMFNDLAEFDHLSEQMESFTKDVLVNQLQIPEEKVEQHNKYRDQYFAETTKIYQTNPTELTIKQRKKLLDIEEQYIGKLHKLYGKDTWSKLEKFRKEYNEQALKRMREENAPAVLMAP